MPRAIEAADADVRAQFTDPAAFDEWASTLARSASRWSRRSAAERQAAMRAVNPAFIPRNHRVEAVIQAAVNNDDYAPFEELVKVLAKPFEDQPDVCGLRRSAAAGPARAADVLRDVSGIPFLVMWERSRSTPDCFALPILRAVGPITVSSDDTSLLTLVSYTDTFNHDQEFQGFP